MSGPVARPSAEDGIHARHSSVWSARRYGITDGPAYRDLDDPGAALFHISVEDMDTAMGWFRSDTFK